MDTERLSDASLQTTGVILQKNHNLDTPLRNFNLLFSAVLLSKLQN